MNFCAKKIKLRMMKLLEILALHETSHECVWLRFIIQHV